MSTASKGASRVGSAMTMLSKLDYRCARISASGQRKGRRRNECGIPGDVVAFAPVNDAGLPHLLIEIDGAGKRLAVTFAELHEHPLPAGFCALVGVVVGRRWRWYIDSYSRRPTLDEALESLKQ